MVQTGLDLWTLKSILGKGNNVTLRTLGVQKYYGSTFSLYLWNELYVCI